jgi:hypothetical protein
VLTVSDDVPKLISGGPAKEGHVVGYCHCGLYHPSAAHARIVDKVDDVGRPSRPSGKRDR